MAKKILTFVFVVFIYTPLFIVLLSPVPARAAGASFVLAPATMAVAADTQFTVSVTVNSAAPINAAQGTVTFPTDKLRVISLSKSGSIVQFWASEPSFSNTGGTVDFSGGLPSPGFNGSGGVILRITFRASGSGMAAVNIAQGAILANDGQGTNILQGISSGAYTIGAAAPVTTSPAEVANQVISQAYPDSNKWYNHPAADFSWTLVPGTDKVSYELTQTAGGVPGTASSVTDKAEYPLTDRRDGVWYFHVQLHTNGAWGSVLTKKIKVDREPPRIGELRATGDDASDPRPSFRWAASDQTSDIDSYRVQVDGGDWLVPSPRDATTITLPTQTPGKHTLVVEARDLAGNTATATANFTIEPIASPEITDYPRTVDAAASGTSQTFTISGTVSKDKAVKVYLKHGSETLAVSAIVAADGSWAATYDGSKLAAGTWLLTAQAVDARGALSAETTPAPITVKSKVVELIRFSAGWGAAGLVALFALALIAFAFFAVWARLQRYRLKMRKEIVMAQMAFIKDFEQLEKDMEGGRAGKLREKVTHDMDSLAKDIGKELEKLKKDVD